eukprot:357806-Chlamydomonas_euryale.AAC.10
MRAYASSECRAPNPQPDAASSVGAVFAVNPFVGIVLLSSGWPLRGDCPVSSIPSPVVPSPASLHLLSRAGHEPHDGAGCRQQQLAHERAGGSDTPRRSTPCRSCARGVVGGTVDRTGAGCPDYPGRRAEPGL